MKHRSLFTVLIISMIGLFQHSYAQVDVAIGTGTTGNSTNSLTTGYPCPLQDYYEGHRAQYLYRASELTAAGMGPGSIGRIKFNVVSLGTAGLIEQFTIKIGGSTVTTLGTASWEPVSATVFGPVDYQPVAGINTFTLSTPYFWNGTDNIIIEVCNGQPGNATGIWYTVNPVVPWTTGLAFNGSHTYAADNLNNLCGTATTTQNGGVQTTRPNIIFNWTSATACSGTPVAGTATSTLTNILCPGASFTLGLTGQTIASGLTYQWQSSLDNINFSNITGATSITYTTTQTETVKYYRCIVSCGAASSNSASVQVNSVSGPVYATLPVNESFENTWINSCDTRDIPNASWKNTPLTGNASWRRDDDGVAGAAWTSNNGTYTPTGSAGVRSARFHSYNATSGTAGTFDLYVNCNTPSATKRLIFDHINTSGTDTVSILLSTDGGTTFTRIDSLGVSATWRTKTIQFNSTSATTVIRLRAVSDFGTTDIGIDNLKLNEFANCSGAPVAGTATSSITNILCPGTPITLDLTGQTVAAGLTYQWQSSLDNITFTNIAGATTLPYITTQAETVKYYRCVVTCGASSSNSASVQVNSVSGPVYASLPVVESFENTWINSCGTRDIPNVSWKTTPISGNTSWRRDDDGVAGGGWTGNLGVYAPTGSDGVRSARFHSYNAASGTAGTFDLYVNCNTGSAPKRLIFDHINTSGSDTLSILISTDGGTTFNRIDSVGISATWRSKTVLFNSTSATTVIRFRAVSDFGTTDIGIDNINLISFSPCTGTPVGGTAATSNNNVCLATTFTLSVAGATDASGLTYQWQSSPDNSTWTNIPGATNATLSTTQVASTYYRRVITCTGSSASANSTSVLVSSPTAVSGTFTINSALPTGGTNFQTYNAAYDYIKCGINGPVVFNVNAASGPYTEQLIMTAVPGASNINTVTFNGFGTTLKFSSANTNERAVIKLNGADHIRFDSIVIDARGGTYGYGVHLTNNADSNIIRKCTILAGTVATTLEFAGIVMSATGTSATSTGTTLCDGNTFANNNIIGGYYGVTLVGSTTDAVRLNNVVNNKITDFANYGVYALGNFGTLIEGNDISRPTRTANLGFNGVFLTSLNVAVKVSKNRIHEPYTGTPTATTDFTGVYLSGVDAFAGLENVVSNNLIYDVNGQGLIYALYDNSSDNAWFHHNTISLDNTASTSTAVTRGFYQLTAASGIDLQNNIITISRGGTGTKHAIFIGTATTTYTSNRNDLYVNAAAGSNFIGNVNATDYATLAAWRTGSTQDANSVSSNPIYANPAAGNYSPINAAIDNLGAPLGYTTDLVNTARSATTPDMGCYEFTPANCTAPPLAGTSIVNITSSICQGLPITLDLNGNSFGLNQTYQWQSSPTLAGSYTNVSGVLTNPQFNTNTTSTLYYRAAVTCSGNTSYSTPVLVTVDPAFAAGTYTINKALPTGGTNFNSFNAAYNALRCGITGPVVFNVVSGSGPYAEQLIMGPVRGTSAVNTVTFNGNGNTISFASANTNERAVIKFKNTDYFIFDSLTVDASAGTYGFGFHLTNDADSNIIRKCTIITDKTATSTNYAGIVLSASDASATTTGATNCDENLFSNNTITGGYYGITAVGGTTANAPIRNNRFINNKVNDWYAYGVYLTFNDGTLVEGNQVARPTRTNTGTPYGIYLTGLSTRVKVSKNRVFDVFKAQAASTVAFNAIYHTAVDAPAGQENTVTNNAIYDISHQGTLYALANSSSDNVDYYHNTVDINDPNSISTAATYGFYQVTLADGIDFKNNIVSINKGGNGSKYGIYMATTTTTYSSNYNDFFINGTSGVNAVGYNNGTNRNTLADWRTAANQDANSLSTDPIYFDRTVGNFRPKSVILDNKGTNVGITTDILNIARSATTPDPGAYEFNIPPCSNPPLAGTTVAVPNTGICLGTPVRLSLDGYVDGAGQTYQWQYSTALAGPYTNLGASKLIPDTTIEASITYYYRCVVTCSGGTSVNSVPALVSINPAFLSGIYTIDPSLPPSATNFTSFVSAVAALECGITGPVTFRAAPGTYTEQVRMHKVFGAGPNSRVTFESATGVSSSVTLRFSATNAASNYVLELDSASYITYRNMSITALSTTNGRVVEFANNASFDSLVNCVITAPLSTSTSNTIAGVFANGLRGGNNVIKGNTIVNGSSGIYFAGTSATLLTSRNLIDSNTVNGAFYYGIYAGLTDRTSIIRNTVNTAPPLNATAYSIYAVDCDTAYDISSNNVNISNTTGTTYGIYITSCVTTSFLKAKVAGNKVQAITGNTGGIYGLYETASSNNNTVNNVINVKTSSATAYGIYSTTDFNNDYNNNTVHNTSATAGTTNAAAYFNHTTFAAGNVRIRNNIFSHGGGSRAIYFTNTNFIYSDYNFLYTTGTVLVQSTTPAGSYATLDAWKNATNWDVNSMVFKPAFISDNDIRPNVADTMVWAMNGRGVQIAGNDKDINGAPRATTLQAGVPDMGAYEFLPTVLPPRLIGTPAVPAPGTTQTFMFGTDTVTKITWAPGSTVPSSIRLKRYSGAVPPGLAASQPYMYFYTETDVTGTNASNAKVEQYYIDPWQGFINSEAIIKMGKTNAANAWLVNSSSTVDDANNIITESAIPFIGKFTGLTDGNAPPTPPVIIASGDSSNRGTKFWVGYGHHQYFGTDNSQNMVIYMSAEQPANVTIRINGTSWSRTYAVPGNSVLSSVLIPKSGIYDARLLEEGLSNKAISITSDVPVVAYAHIYASTTSGATMLLPIGTYGYEYVALTSNQNYAANTYSWVNVIAEYDSTLVEITPSAPTLGGRPANVPFQVYLNKGDVYQVMGAIISGSDGYDMTGTKVASRPNAAGRCFPIAVFSGSSRTNIGCAGTSATGSGDNIIQQNFPSQAWGVRYLTAPTSNATAANSLHTNIYRVAVKDPTTVVRRNGVTLTGLISNFYYQYESNTADLITADKPVMVAQFMSSSGYCPNTSGDGDPEMFYISPIEQGIKKVALYRNTLSAIDEQYVTLIIPTAGVASLQIDGSNVFDYTYPHPNLAGYTVVVKRWGTATQGQTRIQSDSAFTAITYGEGSVESYGYNAGTLVKNLNALTNINNTLNTSGNNLDYTCVKSPFRFSILVNLKPTQIRWRFSAIPNMTPNVDSVQINPVPVDSVDINGRRFYRYVVRQDYTIADVGVYIVPVTFTHPSIEGCNSTQETQVKVTVVPGPKADFTVNFSGCINASAQFNGNGSSGTFTHNRWNWDFGDATTANIQNPTKTWSTPGVKNVKLQVVSTDGCLADTIKPVTVNPLPTFSLVVDSITVCPGAVDTFRINNPQTGAVYNWYTSLTGGTPVFTGVKFPITITSGTVVYFVDATVAGCVSTPRKRVVATVYTLLTAPVATVDSAGVNFVRFKWNAVPNAVSYQVSTDNGATWITPSSGATGLTHTVNNMRPLQTVTLLVKAKGQVSCQDVNSQPVTGRTLPDEIYIPNAFTPNGDGRNDVWLIYGYVIRSVNVVVFDQWGEKIFESSSQQRGWDGTYKGKQQPVGVYVYVVNMTLNDGTQLQKKGSINLVR